MPTTVKTGWLKDKNGDKFAPKTLTSQVQTSDGILIEDKIAMDIDAAKEDILANVSVDSALPSVTSADVGKFLRVSSDGKWVAEYISNAEEVAY